MMIKINHTIFIGGKNMLRDDLISEISMRTDIPMDEVEDILQEEDVIIEEELCRCHKKKCVITIMLIVVFLLGATVAVYVLDRKDKIDVEAVIKKYTHKMKDYLDKEKK